MRVVVAGYDKMLAALINGVLNAGAGEKTGRHEVVGAIRIDRVKYSNFALFFKDIFNPSEDFSFLKSHKIYDIKANSVNSKGFLDEIKRLKADIILVGSWSEKFLEPVLKAPKYGVINCHPSLLPKHRGANPYFWAIYSGDTKSGVTFHIMNKKLDSGDILMQAAFNIEPYMTGGGLKNKASKVAELMVMELLNDIDKGAIIPSKQDENKATYDKYPFEGIDTVDFLEENTIQIFNKVRGLKPWANCSCILEENGSNKVYRINYVKILDNPDMAKTICNQEVSLDESLNMPDKPGKIIKRISDKVFYVKTLDGILEICVF